MNYIIILKILKRMDNRRYNKKRGRGIIGGMKSGFFFLSSIFNDIKQKTNCTQRYKGITQSNNIKC